MHLIVGALHGARRVCSHAAMFYADVILKKGAAVIGR